MSETAGPIGLDSGSYWNVSLVLSALELAFALTFMLLVQTACTLVVRFASGGCRCSARCA